MPAADTGGDRGSLYEGENVVPPSQGVRGKKTAADLALGKKVLHEVRNSALAESERAQLLDLAIDVLASGIFINKLGHC